MIITICSKFGTRGFGVAVGVGEGVDVNVAAAGKSVEVCVTRGGVGDVSVGVPKQASSTIITMIQKPKRFMKFMVMPLLVYYRLNERELTCLGPHT
jgi:hypothetical protein